MLHQNTLNASSLHSDRAMFVVVSFEGTDAYSQAGGLGVRVTGLVRTLAELDYETHLFFIGDPSLPGEEATHGGRLILHRWAQWISANCPGGVYDGEAGKVVDVTTALPVYLVDHLLAPAIAAGRIPILLFEEWQTAECACRVSDALIARGLRERAVLAWNANNPYGFERIDWLALAAAATITTISRHMRSIIRTCGADARVIPNGIPDDAFAPIDRGDVAQLRATVGEGSGAGLLFKMARWEREKGWTQALEAISYARALEGTPTLRGRRAPLLVARSGGPTGRGVEVADEAASRNLRVVSFDSEREFIDGMPASAHDADVVSLRFGVSPALARTLYAASDGVLANSVSEPFGLVGLETMAAGGVAFTGGTGEDYAVDGRNSVVLETLEPAEIAARWSEIAASPELAGRLRRAARKTSREYGWRTVIDIVIGSVTRDARRQGLLPPEQPTIKAPPATERALKDDGIATVSRSALPANPSGFGRHAGVRMEGYDPRREVR